MYNAIVTAISFVLFQKPKTLNPRCVCGSCVIHHTFKLRAYGGKFHWKCQVYWKSRFVKFQPHTKSTSLTRNRKTRRCHSNKPSNQFIAEQIQTICKRTSRFFWLQAPKLICTRIHIPPLWPSPSLLTKYFV